MLRYLARRLVLTVPVLFGVATLVFSLIHLIPGDPAQAMLGETAPQADVEELRRRLGLDRPLLEQYGAFLTGVLKGDLGTSLRTGEPKSASLAQTSSRTASAWGRVLCGRPASIASASDRSRTRWIRDPKWA